MNSFGIGPNLYPLRLVLPITFVFYYCFFKKFFTKANGKSSFNCAFFNVIFYFNVYSNLCVTIIRAQLFEANYELNSILNFTFLMFLILTIYLIILSFQRNF